MTDQQLHELYNIRGIGSLQTFLQPGYSLCVIHYPEWVEFKQREYIDDRVRLITVNGHTRKNAPDELLLGICDPQDQGYYRQKLDKNLKSAFLFASWKSDRHEFKLIHNHETIANYNNLADALAAYLPDGFIPEHSLESKTHPDVFDPESLQIGEGPE